jgi:hypothetical protein
MKWMKFSLLNKHYKTFALKGNEDTCLELILAKIKIPKRFFVDRVNEAFQPYTRNFFSFCNEANEAMNDGDESKLRQGILKGEVSLYH